MASSAVLPNRVYEDFDPPSDLVSEDACDTFLLYLPGFKKEQLRVQLTTSRLLKISGERAIGDNKWRRFHKEVRIPANCDTTGITAKFEGGILYIRQPKVIAPAAAAETPKTQQPQAQPLPQAQAQPLPQPLPQPKPQSQSQAQQPQQPRVAEKPEEIRKTNGKATPESRPQPYQEAPLSQENKKDAPAKLTEEAEKKEGRKEEAIARKEKDKILDKVKGKLNACGLTQKPKPMVYGSSLFKELRKPETLKRLGISVLLVLMFGFYASYIAKSFKKDGQKSLMEFNGEL